MTLKEVWEVWIDVWKTRYIMIFAWTTAIILILVIIGVFD